MMRRMAPSRWFLAAVVLDLVLNLAAVPAFAHESDTLVPAPRAPSPPVPAVSVGAAESHAKVWPWLLLGAGALTLGGGIWLVHRDDTDNPAPACTTVPSGRTTCPYGTATAWQGWMFVAIGAQLAIAGAAWRIYEVRHAKQTVSLVAGLGDLSLVGRF
jgi:hypothetical protein